MSPAFEGYIGIDYSGAETAIAEWLIGRLTETQPTIVGIDHGLSFPLKYFAKYGLPHDWSGFLKDFRDHWPTDDDSTYVDFVREGACGMLRLVMGDSHWRRLTEVRARAKSVFHFDVPGSVAKSTHAGIQWLLYLRNRLPDRTHFWPFDGWQLPTGKSAVVEVYPALCPEADCYGEDLILRRPTGELLVVQLKGRPTVDRTRYGNKDLWMLFPGARTNTTAFGRKWFLVLHDKFYEWVKAKHGHTPKWNEAWNYPLFQGCSRCFSTSSKSNRPSWK